MDSSREGPHCLGGGEVAGVGGVGHASRIQVMVSLFVFDS